MKATEYRRLEGQPKERGREVLVGTPGEAVALTLLRLQLQELTSGRVTVHKEPCKAEAQVTYFKQAW